MENSSHKPHFEKSCHLYQQFLSFQLLKNFHKVVILLDKNYNTTNKTYNFTDFNFFKKYKKYPFIDLYHPNEISACMISHKIYGNYDNNDIDISYDPTKYTVCCTGKNDPLSPFRRVISYLLKALAVAVEEKLYGTST